MNTGEYAWKIPLGEYPELAEKGVRDTGTENYGGPIVTAGGLVFIGATDFDRKFRAFDKLTGKLLWDATLPMAGNATPATYEAGGRQFVVIYATGGKGRPGDPKGGIYIAFALPRTSARRTSRGAPNLDRPSGDPVRDRWSSGGNGRSGRSTRRLRHLSPGAGAENATQQRRDLRATGRASPFESGTCGPRYLAGGPRDNAPGPMFP